MSPRGGPVKRTRTVSVRLTPAEWEAWEERRARSGQREMGAWVRVVVTDAADVRLAGGRAPGEPRVVPEVNQDAYRQLVGAAANLNQIARRLNASGELERAGLPSVAVVLDELRSAARAVQGRDVKQHQVGIGSRGSRGRS